MRVSVRIQGKTEAEVRQAAKKMKVNLTTVRPMRRSFGFFGYGYYKEEFKEVTYNLPF